MVWIWVYHKLIEKHTFHNPIIRSDYWPPNCYRNKRGRFPGKTGKQIPVRFISREIRKTIVLRSGYIRKWYGGVSNSKDGEHYKCRIEQRFLWHMCIY